jgi:hypothetical protein
VSVHVEGIAAGEARASHDAVLGGDAFDPLQDEPDEAVAFAFHAAHDLAAVDALRALDMHAECRRGVDRMGGLGGGDEQLGGHAADAGAGGAVGAGLHDRGAGAARARGPVGG